MIKLFLFLFMSACLPIQAATELGAEQLVVVQAVSTTGKTFAIRKGAQEGLSVGQESIFSTESMSIRARVIETNRSFSVWKIKETRSRVPFLKGDIIRYSNSLENLWSYLPKKLKRPTKTFKQSSRWQIKGSYSYGLSESTSGVDSSITSSRTGLQFEAAFVKGFQERWEWHAGFRYDSDVITLNEVGIDTTTNRYLLTGDLLYYFDDNERANYRLYIAGGVAYGLSNSTLEESTSSGTALILPSVKVGFTNRLSVKYSLIAEASIESLSQSESFEDSDPQDTQITSTKITVGLRF